MKTKKKPISLLGVMLAVLLIMSTGTWAQFEPQHVSEKTWAAFPKNLALFHILVILTPSRWEKPELFNNPLVQTTREYFKDFRDHPAVGMTDQIFKSSWYFLLNYVALFYSDLPEAEPLQGLRLPDEIQKDENLKKTISAYLEAARAFCSASKFQEFWESRRSEFTALVQELAEGFNKYIDSPFDPKAKILPVDIPALMEKFYGSRADRYYFVPCPFMQNSATHVEIRTDAGENNFYFLQGGDFYKNRFYTVYYAFHEFGHSFIEPISAKYAGTIAQLSHLFPPMRENMRKLGYGDWDRAFNEHLIRAGELHLTGKAFGDAVMARMKEMEVGPYFKLIDHFYACLKEYDNKRDKYVDLESFFPEILEKLSLLRAQEFRRPDRMGFIAQFQDDALSVKDIVPNSVSAQAGLQKGDLLISIQGDLIASLEGLNDAREKWWVSAKEGDSVELVIRREGKEMKLRLPVPFIPDVRYVETEK